MPPRSKKPPSGEAAASVSIWRLGGLPWQELLRRVWHEIYEGGLLTHAAALGFYFLFALFPLLLILATLLAFFGETGAEVQSSLLRFLSRIAPPSAFKLVEKTIAEKDAVATGWRLWLGLISALWFASLGIVALSESLNVMYGVHETRRWIKVRITSMALTAVLMTLIVAALILMLEGGETAAGIESYIARGNFLTSFWSLAQVPFALVFALVAFAMIYFYAPDLVEQKWYWITPGSIIGVVLWIAVSSILRFYLSHFDMYSKTYGSLGAVIVLMLWLYLTGACILLGGKVNAEIENAAARAGVPEAKLRGEKEPDHHPNAS